jgi:hypothetical protein
MNETVETCFCECVSFPPSSKLLEKKEEECMMTCLEKLQNFNQRVGSRFQEYQVAQQPGQ